MLFDQIPQQRSERLLLLLLCQDLGTVTRNRIGKVIVETSG